MVHEMLADLRRKLTYKARAVATRRALALWNATDVERHLATMLATTDLRPLTAPEARLIDDYARDVFGSVDYAPWLRFYAVYRGEFVEGWVPENFFQSVAIPFVNGVYHKICFARTLQARLIGPAIPDLLHFASGDWFDTSGERIDRREVARILFEDRDEVCVKTEGSFFGTGVSFETAQGFDIDRVEARGNLVVQRMIRQHAFYDAISPHAVATLRVATGRPPGARPMPMGASLRVGCGAARAIGASSLDIPLNDAGALEAYGVADDWSRLTTHPDTGVAFAGLAVPDFERIVAQCLKLHDRLPQFGYIGWDAVIDADGAVQVMEFNTGRPQIQFLEMACGPCLVPLDVAQYRGMKRKDNWA